MYRLDKAELLNTKVTSEGFLKTRARVGRTGILIYRLPDGTVRRELRPLEELSHSISLDSLKGKPVVNEHPHKNGGELTIDNAGEFMVGFTGETPHIENDKYLGINVTITDKKTLQDIDSKKKYEISAGYFCDHENTPGVFEGQPYDVVQRNIRYNHVAIVPRGRAGNEVRLMLDSEIEPLNTGELMAKIKIDAEEFEVAAGAATAFEAKMSALEKKLEDLMKELETLKGEKEAMSLELDTTTEKKAQLDSLVEKLNSHEHLKGIVHARVTLLNTAAKFVDTKAVKLDDLTDIEVKKSVVLAKYPTAKLDEASEAKIDGMFEMAVNLKSEATTTKLATAIVGITKDSADSNKSLVDLARERVLKRNRGEL